jgi:hypothetical protein
MNPSASLSWCEIFTTHNANSIAYIGLFMSRNSSTFWQSVRNESIMWLFLQEMHDVNQLWSRRSGSEREWCWFNVLLNEFSSSFFITWASQVGYFSLNPRSSKVTSVTAFISSFLFVLFLVMSIDRLILSLLIMITSFLGMILWNFCQQFSGKSAQNTVTLEADSSLWSHSTLCTSFLISWSRSNRWQLLTISNSRNMSSLFDGSSK